MDGSLSRIGVVSTVIKDDGEVEVAAGSLNDVTAFVDDTPYHEEHHSYFPPLNLVYNPDVTYPPEYLNPARSRPSLLYRPSSGAERSLYSIRLRPSPLESPLDYPPRPLGTICPVDLPGPSMSIRPISPSEIDPVMDEELKMITVEDVESEQRRADRKDHRRMQNRLAQRAFRVRSKTNRSEAQAVAHLEVLENTAQDQASQLESMRGLVQQLKAENARLEAVNLERAEESDVLRIYILAKWG